MVGRRSGLAVASMVLAAFAGGFLAQWLAGARTAHAQEVPAPELRVQRLVIVDPAGAERAVIGVEGAEGEGVALHLNDREGRERVLLGSWGLQGPPEQGYWTIAFKDADGVNRIGWGARDDGLGCGGHMTDAEGVMRLGIGAAENGTGISLKDESGQERLGIGVGPGGGGDFVAKDQFGNDLWRALGQLPQPELP